MDRDWTIERLVPGGAGMARLEDGRVGFVSGAVPGERVHVDEFRQKKSHVEATRFSLLEKSPERVTPPCPHAEACGGCDWMHLSVEAQRKHKLDVLSQALERTGGFHDVPALEMRVAGSPEEYRSRLRLQIDEAGRIGLFAGGSHDLAAIESCMVSDPRIVEALGALREASRDAAASLGFFQWVEIRVSPSDGSTSLCFEPRDPERALPAALRVCLNALGARFLIRPGERVGIQRFELPGGVVLEVPLGAFTQVNWAVNQRLVSELVAGVLSRNSASFCDLYAGAGNFTLPLLKAGLEGVAIEAQGPAIDALRAGARAQGFSGEFLAKDVVSGLAGLLSAGRRFDLVVLDPPRAGARDAVPLLLQLASPTLAYVACDPVTLARDLKALVQGGYELEGAAVYDMFPHTHHFETLAWLRR